MYVATTSNHMWVVGANIVRPGNLALPPNSSGAYGMLPYVGADSISARGAFRCREILRANTVRPYTII